MTEELHGKHKTTWISDQNQTLTGHKISKQKYVWKKNVSIFLKLLDKLTTQDSSLFSRQREGS